MHNEAPTLREKPKEEESVWPARGRPVGPPVAARTRFSSSQTTTPDNPIRSPSRAIERILVPTDFSPCSAKAVELAVALAGQCRASVTLLHVIDINSQYADGQSLPAAEMMKRLWEKGFGQMSEVASALSGRVEARTALEEGLPWELIVEKSRQADLIVLGRGESKPGWQLFSKRTAQRVIEHAACPVMVVRQQN